VHNFLLNIANTGKKKDMDAIANMQLVSQVKTFLRMFDAIEVKLFAVVAMVPSL